MIQLLNQGVKLTILLFIPLMLIRTPWDLFVAVYANPLNFQVSQLLAGLEWAIYSACTVLLAINLRVAGGSPSGGLTYAWRIVGAIAAYMLLIRLPMLGVKPLLDIVGSPSLLANGVLLLVAAVVTLVALAPALCAAHGHNPIGALWRSAVMLLSRPRALLALFAALCIGLAFNLTVELLLPPISRFPGLSRTMVTAFGTSVSLLPALGVCAAVALSGDIRRSAAPAPAGALRSLLIVSGILVPAYMGAIVRFLGLALDRGYGPLLYIPDSLLAYVGLFIPVSVLGALILVISAMFAGWVSYRATKSPWAAASAGLVLALLAIHVDVGSMPFQLPLIFLLFYLLSVILNVVASWGGATVALWLENRRIGAK